MNHPQMALGPWAQQAIPLLLFLKETRKATMHCELHHNRKLFITRKISRSYHLEGAFRQVSVGCILRFRDLYDPFPPFEPVVFWQKLVPYSRLEGPLVPDPKTVYPSASPSMFCMRWAPRAQDLPYPCWRC